MNNDAIRVCQLLVEARQMSMQGPKDSTEMEFKAWHYTLMAKEAEATALAEKVIAQEESKC